MGGRHRDAEPEPADLDASTRLLDLLIALQMADGYWRLTSDLAKLLGWPDARRLRAALGQELPGEPHERSAATALALTWLEREAAAEEDEWRLLADKGREWLDRTPEGAAAWLELAERTLGPKP